ncbi:MAG: SBBP repeat-containing protein [Candidatus Aminicenantes bacterium]|nr:SBBP repeat-containing protein [Candidatus Aminicenantes bacterium]
MVYQFIHDKNRNETKNLGLERRFYEGQKSLRIENIRISFKGKNRVTKTEVRGLEEAGGKVSYFRGNDHRHWVRGARTFRSVVYREIYPLIDLVISYNEGDIKQDFRLKKNADVEMIRLGYSGMKSMCVNTKGELVIETGLGTLKENKPYGYQVINGEKIEVAVDYKLENKNTIGFTLGDYRKDIELIIDPELEYSTFLGGGSEEECYDMAVDSDGNVYVTGYTNSSDFPASTGAYDTSYNFGHKDVFVSKVDSTGTNLIYSTFIGGNKSYEYGNGIAIDGDGNAYVTGLTRSEDFPTTTGANDASLNGKDDAFITKLDTTGTNLIYSTFLGGRNYEEGSGIAVDAGQQAYVFGRTTSDDFPVTPGSFQTSKISDGDKDAFVTKLDSEGNNLLFSTYLGGCASDWASRIAIDEDGNAYLYGSTNSDDFPTTTGAYDTSHNGAFDAFITKLNPTGSELLYSTFLGGSQNDNFYSVDFKGLYGLVVDGGKNVYVVGETMSNDFPTTIGAYDTSHNGLYDVFVAKLDSAGTALLYSTFLGGSRFDMGCGIAVDSSGNCYVTGSTKSDDFPVSTGAYDSTKSGDNDVFVTKLNNTGSDIIHSTYVGGGNSDVGIKIETDTDGYVYLAGHTESENFPVTSEAYDEIQNGKSDVFLTKMTLSYKLIISQDTGGMSAGHLTIPGCGTYTYEEVTQVQIIAKVSPNFKFQRWSGDVPAGQETQTTITITVDADKSITAHFSFKMGGIISYSRNVLGDGDWTCFIATACYGTPFVEEVRLLRRFRDAYLLENEVGRAFVHLYYRMSPAVAAFIRDKEPLKRIVRDCLKPFIHVAEEMLDHR